MGLALMPQACTVDHKKLGTRSTSTGGWLWGVGSNSKSKVLALQLIEHISSYNNQLAECDNFGLVPIRRDILGKANLVFTEPWKTNVFRISMKQVQINGPRVLPYSSDFPKTEKEYIRIWKKVIEKSMAEGVYLDGAAVKKLF